MGARHTEATPRRRRTRRIGVAALVLAGVMVELGCASESPDLTIEAEDTTDDTTEDATDDAGTSGGTRSERTTTTADRDAAAPTTARTSTDPPPPGTDDPEREAGDPVDLLRVAPESDGGVRYDRDEYGGWTTGADGCRTRDTVLIRDARPPGAQVDPYGCTVLAGEWTDPYTNEAVFADDRNEVADLVHVDHVVALSEAHRSGAWAWGRALKRDFANDLDNLLATAASVNISKSDRDPASWQPPALDRWCGFTEIWILTKVRWDLAADRAEVDALRNMRSARSCPDELSDPDPTPSQRQPSASPDTTTTTTTATTTTAAPAPTGQSPSCTPGYDPCIPPGDDVDCAGGSGNGPRYVEGPVYVDHARGDPYRLDGDGDGVACA